MEASISTDKNTDTISLPKDDTNPQDDDDTLLDWDDDESDDLLARLEERLAELPLPSEVKNPNKEETPAVEEETDEDWFVPITTTTLMENGKGNNGSPDEPLMGSGEKNVYLTDQFKRLSTPASQKKARCVICTRPVSGGKPSKYCDRHKVSDGRKSVTFSVPESFIISEE